MDSPIGASLVGPLTNFCRKEMDLDAELLKFTDFSKNETVNPPAHRYDICNTEGASDRRRGVHNSPSLSLSTRLDSTV